MATRTHRNPDDALTPLAPLVRDAAAVPLDRSVIAALERGGVSVTRAKVGNFTTYYVSRVAFERWLAQRIEEGA